MSFKSFLPMMATMEYMSNPYVSDSKNSKKPKKVDPIKKAKRKAERKARKRNKK